MEDWQGLLGYLEENQNSALTEQNPRHEHLVGLIRRDLHLFGVQSPAIVFEDVALWNGRITHGQVDLAVVSNEDLFLIEAKTGITSERHRDRNRRSSKIISQLRRDHDYFMKNFGVSAHLLGTYQLLDSGFRKTFPVSPQKRNAYSLAG